MIKKIYLSSVIIMLIVNTGFSNCPKPTGLAASSITASSAMLSWTTVTGANNYSVQYKKTTSTAWTSIIAATSSTTISGLTASASYEFKVSTYCNLTTSGGYSASKTFSTLSACPTPTGLSTSSITSNSAVLNWNSVIGLCIGCYNNVRYKKTSSSAWTITTAGGVNPNTVSISGLSPSTAYEFQVQSVCNNNPGNYSASKNFNTLSSYVCPMPTGLTAGSITANKAVLNWSAVSGANNYSLRYKKTSSSSWTSIIAASNSKTISGLTASTSYEFQVETYCSLSTSGGYSASKTFTTSHAIKGAEDNEGSSLSSADEHNVNLENTLTVFPNPVQTNLTIRFEADNSFLSVQLININGQIIYNEQRNNYNGSYQQILDLSSNAKGFYFLKIIADDKTITRKIILD